MSESLDRLARNQSLFSDLNERFGYLADVNERIGYLAETSTSEFVWSAATPNASPRSS